MACLVLRVFSHLDYRGLAKHLAGHSNLREPIGLNAVHRHKTFQKAAQRLLAAIPCCRVFDAVLEQARKDQVRGGFFWRPSTARVWSRDTLAATSRSGRPTGSPAATGSTPISKRSSSWSTA